MLEKRSSFQNLLRNSRIDPLLGDFNHFNETRAQPSRKVYRPLAIHM